MKFTWLFTHDHQIIFKKFINYCNSHLPKNNPQKSIQEIHTIFLTQLPVSHPFQTFLERVTLGVGVLLFVCNLTQINNPSQKVIEWGIFREGMIITKSHNSFTV